MGAEMLHTALHLSVFTNENLAAEQLMVVENHDCLLGSKGVLKLHEPIAFAPTVVACHDSTAEHGPCSFHALL